MTRALVRRADGKPAYAAAQPRLRQSEIDHAQAWRLREVQDHHKQPEQPKAWRITYPNGFRICRLIKEN